MKVEPKAIVSKETESWYQRNKHLMPAKRRLQSWRLKTRYGITLEDFEEMFSSQEGRCKICKEFAKLHVDHCHETSKVRGLLCFRCNNGLGSFEDNIERLEAAVTYLRN